MLLAPPLRGPQLFDYLQARYTADSSAMSKNRISERRVAGLLGLAFDAEDGHKRITRGNNFLLAGGSEETHGLMRETIIKVNEELDARGLNLADVSPDELRDMLNDVQP
jgi:hypothetical protein